MNKILLSLFLGIFVFSTATTIFANDLVQFPQGNASWSVKVMAVTSGPDFANTTNSVADTNPPPIGGNTPTMIEVTQVDKLKRIHITWLNGPASEQWSKVGMQVFFQEDPRNGEVSPVMSQHPLALHLRANMPPYDVNDFSWISESCLKENDPVLFHGKHCFHYVGSVEFPMEKTLAQKTNNVAPQKNPREAWIDSETLLPVAIATGGAFCVFTFSDTPPSTLVMPQKFQDALNYYIKVMGL